MKWQAVLDLARDTLNDDAKTRYTDTAALMHGNDAVREAYAIRPDLRLGVFGTANTEATTPATDDFPLPDQYKRAVADYIIGRLETRNATISNNDRAAFALQAFKNQMLGA